MKLIHRLFWFCLLLPLVALASDIAHFRPATTLVLTAQGESFEARDRASHALGHQLPASDVSALLDFLNRTPGDDSASEDELASIKNNAADALLAQNEFPSGLLAAFEKAFADPDQGEIWREYVVQKIPELVARASSTQRERGMAFLRARLSDTSYIYAGTALLGVQRLHEAPNRWVSSNEVADAARKILAEDGYAAASKTTALQILAKHQPGEARALARQWLTEDTPVMHRVSALATLGSVGVEADREFLTRFAASPEIRLRKSARAALARLEMKADL